MADDSLFAMRLFIWEGAVSTGYHDDGTLVVLARTPEEARAIARASAAPVDEDGYLVGYRDQFPGDVWTDGNLKYDYSDETCSQQIDREPDRIVEIDGPKMVAFNGGGYD